MLDPALRPAPLTGLFAAAADPRQLGPLEQLRDVEINRYAIEHVVPVCGAVPEALATASSTAWTMLRLVGPGPFEALSLPGCVEYRGSIGHLQYTTAADRNELTARSRAALPPGPDTVAVLIPIRKTQAWWSLAQDQRQEHFRRDTRHTAIGLRYVDRIFRTLYHARYLGARSRYDFITYFELPRAASADFRELLAALRDPGQNPEWAFVDLEYEIWSTKIA